jgi:hypothetical protein
MHPPVGRLRIPTTSVAKGTARVCTPCDLSEHHPKFANVATTSTVAGLISTGGHDNFAGFLFDLAGQLTEESTRSVPIVRSASARTLFSSFRIVTQRN